MENKILTYDSVEISFDGEAVVHDVSFSLTPGEILGLRLEVAEQLVGASGDGIGGLGWAFFFCSL